MTMTTNSAPGKSYWGRNIVIVYSVFALSTLAFVAFAMTQRVDLTSQDYYEQALRHDSTQMALRRAADAGVRVEMGDSIAICLPAGMSIEHRISVELTRADDPSLDRRLSIAVADDNRVTIPIAGLTRGRWHLQARWRSAGLEHLISQPVRVGR